ncbi:hypothetical protein Mal15_06980 [Stieleria maiorica]|uniref:Uncharacterized protein n=1 Tax=Stieleria maiorica TaxID=2795974 RepID=A0A5B9M9F4_9BACT|nr:glycosyltransferase family 39 protein [Stieleria maiorica]QEF96670.1 hypothetical protein Mal15_06980 [Stieleria maiorica]
MAAADQCERTETEIGKIDRRAIWFAMLLVGGVALAFRLPSCRESFWLDELHSAWAVADNFSLVAPRAAAGNQTTGYFHLLWAWSALVGPDEFPMRLSSVLASVLASVLLVVGVARRTGNVSAGVVAGGMLAIDPNGVFFGCELRAYAFVMLYAVLAVWSMMAWLGASPERRDHGATMGRRHGSERSHGGARWRLAMLFWICVAALVHPTSLGVLALLVPFAVLVAWNRQRLRLWRADLIAVVIVSATLAALVMSSLPESWERRGLWKAFGQATTWWQLWYAWSWGPIVMLPVGAAVVTFMASRLVDALRPFRKVQDEDGPAQVDWIGMIPGSVGVIGTALFFCASYFEWVPLWHRRYFVAALPLMAWTAGESSAICVAAVGGMLRRWSGQRSGVNRIMTRAIGIAVAALLVGHMLWYQGTLQTLAAGRWPVQWRGEHWRGAVAEIREEIRDGDVVWLDSQLIEASFLRQPISSSGTISERQWEYLAFPLRGPYTLDPVVVVGAYEHESWIRHHLENLPRPGARVWLISRSGVRPTERFIDRLNRYRPVTAEQVFPGRPVVYRLVFVE